MSIGDRIKRCREARGLTQLELAQRLDMKNGSTVANWERGYSSPSVERIAEICGVMRVSADYLLGTVGADDFDIDGLDAIKVIYPTLDERGQSMVLAVLNAESTYCQGRDKEGDQKVNMRLDREDISDASKSFEKYIERDHPKYYEMADLVKSQLRTLKKETGKGNEGLLYYLWWNRLPVRICLADIVAIFRGIKVPSPEIYRYMEAYYLDKFEVILK